QFTTSWHADTFRSWQLRTNPLFDLRTRSTAICQTEDWRGNGCGSPRRQCRFFHARCQRGNSGSGFYWRYCCNRRRFQRRFDRFWFFNRFWNRLIPGRKLFTFTGSLLFHFFKIVKRRTRGFCLFYNGFRLHNRLLFNGLRLLVQRLLSGWLLISLLSLVCRLWSKSGLLLFGLPGVTCHRLFWRRGVIRLLNRLFRRRSVVRLLRRLFSCRCIIRLLRLYWLLQRLIILHCRLRIL